MILNDDEILDLFYNQIIKEAALGEVNCFFTYNIFFDTVINNSLVEPNNSIYNNDVIKPKLIISNKDNFNYYLLEYTKKARNFYDKDNFPSEEELKSENVSKEKIIMTLLWGNATYYDFENPISYLQRRINYFENSLDSFDCYISPLDLNLSIKIEKEIINFETPYKMIIKLFNDNDTYEFPKINFGVNYDSVDIYSMQNSKIINDGMLAKKLNRLFYKIGLSEDEDLNNITPSFVIASSIALSYFKKNNISFIRINDLLIERYNAKRIMINKNKYTTAEEKNNFIEHQDNIQNNITQKFINTFLRLASQTNGVNVLSFPDSLSSYLTLYVEENFYSDNELLNTFYQSIDKNQLIR